LYFSLVLRSRIYAKIIRKLDFVDSETVANSFMIVETTSLDGKWKENGKDKEDKELGLILIVSL
jgi:hypothetical protein